MFRIIAFLLVATTLIGAEKTAIAELTAADSELPLVVAQPMTDVQLTLDQQALVDEARGLFASAGIVLPAVTSDFPTEVDHCFGYGGIYSPKTVTVRICRPSMRTMVHELAHSWIETILTEAERQSFMKSRGLDTWAGGDHWDERAAEHAAEIITWAVLDEDISVRWVETNGDGSTFDTTRLFKVPNTDRETLVSAYLRLTGQLPHNRMAERSNGTDGRPISGLRNSIVPGAQGQPT